MHTKISSNFAFVYDVFVYCFLSFFSLRTFNKICKSVSIGVYSFSK